MFFLTVLSVALLLGASPGEPFTDLGFEAALEQAKKTEKLLLVDFTASWCAPCKKMDRDTWSDSGVRSWLAEHALAIQIDIDEEKELAKRFAIEAVPTVVAFRGGTEFDRIRGYRDAAAFLGWTRAVLAGKRSTDELMERARALADSTDVEARRDLARELLGAKLYDAALEHYLWLWPASRDAIGMGGIRLSFMLGEMAELAKKHEPARKAFLEILEGLQTKIDGAQVPSFEDWQEWTAWCQNFEENPRVIAWYERHCDEDGCLFEGRTTERPQHFILTEVFDLLIEEERPLDAARLIKDGREHAGVFLNSYEIALDANSRIAAVTEAEDRDRTEDWERDRLRHDLSNLYGALLLAGRTDEAVGVADLLLKTLDDADSRLALVRAGIDLVKRQEASFSIWLDEAETAGASVRLVRRRLEKLPVVEEKAPAPESER